jgi:hypothetical protein
MRPRLEGGGRRVGIDGRVSFGGEQVTGHGEASLGRVGG